MNQMESAYARNQAVIECVLTEYQPRVNLKTEAHVSRFRGSRDCWIDGEYRVQGGVWRYRSSKIYVVRQDVCVLTQINRSNLARLRCYDGDPSGTKSAGIHTSAHQSDLPQ